MPDETSAAYARHPSAQPALEAVYDDFTESEWCDRCLLPSAVSMTQLIYTKRTLELVKVRRLLLCRDCGDYRVIECSPG